MTQSDDGARLLLRHTLATLAYRGGKALRGAPEGFAAFQAGNGARTPGQLLAHLGDLLDWACALADGEHEFGSSKPLAWNDDVARFFAVMERLDRRLADDEPLGVPPERLFQGPVADALAHVGQIILLRRLAGAHVRSENYFDADVQAGHVGSRQVPPKAEFD